MELQNLDFKNLLDKILFSVKFEQALFSKIYKDTVMMTS